MVVSGVTSHFRFRCNIPCGYLRLEDSDTELIIGAVAFAFRLMVLSALGAQISAHEELRQTATH